MKQNESELTESQLKDGTSNWGKSILRFKYGNLADCFTSKVTKRCFVYYTAMIEIFKKPCVLLLGF